MYRATILVLALLFPSVAAAQQPCTTDARPIVNELYRHMLERQPDAGSAHWVQQLENGRMTVRDVVRSIATSPEYMERFVYTESGEGTAYERSVGRLYRHLLGRQPDSEGQNNFARLAQQSGMDDVIDRILASNEYRQRYGDWGVPGSGGLRYCPSNRANTGVNNDQVSDNTLGRPFRVIDSNADGVISRQEWRAASGSMPSFNQMDANNDNRITRYEFRGGADQDRFGVEPTTGESVVVDGRNEWTDTGMRVRAGELIVFDVTGTVRMSGEPGDIATAAGARSGRRAPNSSLSSQPAGALIGRIDNGAPFFIGNRRSIRANSTGRLYLGVNDDYLEDNSGAFQVMMSVE